MLPVILSSVAVILFLILSLALMIVYAKTKLTPSGSVSIVVNGDSEKPIITQPGTNLLSTLSESKLFLPSACGGGGTCAMCKCQIIEGGGDVLPTEKNHLTRKEQNEHWRLACQVKVREDMQIKVPEEIFGIQKWECEVVSNENVATFIKDFIVKLPEGEHLEFEAGGYIQIYIPSYKIKFRKDIEVEERFREDWDKFNLWDLNASNDEEIFRAYSMANHPAEGNIIKLNVRIASPPWDNKKNGFMDVPPGIASSYIFALKPGDKVTVSGPYGEFFVKPTEKEMCYIGGGAGMAPLRSHVFDLLMSKNSKRKISYWYGGRSLRELFYTEEFRELEKEHPNFSYHIALSEPLPEDNWTGSVGFIHKVVLEEYLSKHPEPEEIEYYLCGPPMMLQAVMKMLDDLGVPPENIAFDDFGN
ncbi:MAG: NADH:ubiquinone reductase (Na(+)-transporting) subunit F [Bacteroidia bacterium]